jgi:hypothetical protein
MIAFIIGAACGYAACHFQARLMAAAKHIADSIKLREGDL